MFLVAPVIIYHTELTALGIAAFRRFVLVVMFYLIPDVEQHRASISSRCTCTASSAF